MTKEVRHGVADYGVDRFLIRFIPDLVENSAFFPRFDLRFRGAFFGLRNFFV
jgi:hypothetical protein